MFNESLLTLSQVETCCNSVFNSSIVEIPNVRRVLDKFHTLPGLLDSRAALSNSYPNALRAIQ